MSARTPARSGAVEHEVRLRHRRAPAAPAPPPRRRRSPATKRISRERHPRAGARVVEAVRRGDDHRRRDQRRGAEPRAGDVEPPDAAERRGRLGVEQPPLLGRPPATAAGDEQQQQPAQHSGRRAPAAAARRSPSRAARRCAPPAPRVPAPICIMQPMLPAAITCGAALLERRHLARAGARRRSPAAAGCRCRPSRSRDGRRAARPPRSRPRPAAPSARRATCWPCCSEQAA